MTPYQLSEHQSMSGEPMQNVINRDWALLQSGCLLLKEGNDLLPAITK